tara:strand:+ start:206 stop:682 length:477 start_codon:yes stop_codon:yes gene_type:complete
MSSQLDINSLFETTNLKQLKRLETYDKILKQCHYRIKHYSKHEMTTCFFAIPEFLIGVPLYDVDELKTYMINSLEKNGFKLMYLHPNWLMIDWTEKKKSLQQVKKATDITQSTIKKIQKDYKPIEEYKPTGRFVYNQNSMSSLEEKTKQILHVGKLNI